jgi:hypothetical protein
MTSEAQCKAFYDAIAEHSDWVRKEIEERSKDKGPEVNKYNENVVFGLRLAISSLLDAMERQHAKMKDDDVQD